MDRTMEENDMFNSPDPSPSQLEHIQDVADNHFGVYYPFNSPPPSPATLRDIREMETLALEQVNDTTIRCVFFFFVKTCVKTHTHTHTQNKIKNYNNYNKSKHFIFRFVCIVI